MARPFTIQQLEDAISEHAGMIFRAKLGAVEWNSVTSDQPTVQQAPSNTRHSASEFKNGAAAELALDSDG